VSRIVPWTSNTFHCQLQFMGCVYFKIMMLSYCVYVNLFIWCLFDVYTCT